jgi:hypothetical protein
VFDEAANKESVQPPAISGWSVISTFHSLEPGSPTAPVGSSQYLFLTNELRTRSPAEANYNFTMNFTRERVTLKLTAQTDLANGGRLRCLFSVLNPTAGRTASGTYVAAIVDAGGNYGSLARAGDFAV